MDMKLVKKGIDFSWKKKKWLLLVSACGFTGYGLFRVYNSPFIAHKRKRVSKLFGALVCLAEAVSDSAEAVGVVSRDLKEFLQSETDQIPNSLKQISKVMNSDEFSDSVVNVTQALTSGFLRGYQSQKKFSSENGDSSFVDKVMDKLFTKSGSGFMSVVVGSFARNLVMAFYSNERYRKNPTPISSNSIIIHQGGSDKNSNSIPRWVNVVCDNDKCRELIADCVELFVSTAVGVYLEKTMDINTYDEFFAGLTNPKHETKVRDTLVAVCNGAIKTLVKTSHEVLSNSNPSSDLVYSGIPNHPGIHQGVVGNRIVDITDSLDEVKDSDWVRQLSSTLAVPNNRRFVMDVTGRVTYEMVRSFLEFLLQKVYDGMQRSVDSVQEAIVDSGVDAMRYATAKSSVIATVCLSLCLHILDSVWILAPN